ncbi:MAG: 1-phosphofructokinase [Chthonomonas sp.]|nr:1-phosphofructokinase [Fimbriimonadaceae bacterium]
MILSVTLNPCVDYAAFCSGIELGEVNRVIRTETDAGGKGVNLSRVVRELDVATVATGWLGGEAGEFVANVLAHQGVSADFVPIAGETRVNFSVEDGTGRPPTQFNAPGPLIADGDLARLEAKLIAVAPDHRYAAVGGSAPPGVPDDVFARLVGLLKSAGCYVALDADGARMSLGLASRPHLIKPNTSEAEGLLGRTIEGLDEHCRAARDLAAFGAESVLLSMGKDGAVLYRPHGMWHAIPPKVEVRSTIGSGDSLLGGYLAGLATGLDDAEALRLGTACGAATATTDGSQIARREVIEALLGQVLVRPL